MSNNVKDLLKRRNEAQEKQQATRKQQSQGAEGVAIEMDDGDLPQIMPEPGDVVVLSYGDPSLIDMPLVDIPVIVTLVDAKNGRLNGQMILDPSMQGMGPGGRPVQMPPVAPVANVPHSAKPRAMTWRHHGQKSLLGRLLGMIAVLDNALTKLGERVQVLEKPVEKLPKRSRKLAAEVLDAGPTSD